MKIRITTNGGKARHISPITIPNITFETELNIILKS